LRSLNYSLLIIIFAFFSCKKDKNIINGCTDSSAANYNPYAIFDDGSCLQYITTSYIINIPNGFPLMQIPSDNPMTVEGVELGEKLFFDPILSADNSISCATCHIKSNSFSQQSQYSVGIDGIAGFRNASALINLGWNSSYNWDGSASSLEEQAFEPVTNPIEMHNEWGNVETELNQNEQYRDLFKKAFNIDYIDSVHVVKAIAQFERSLVSYNSKYDKFIRQEIQLTPSELNGLTIFNTEKGDCFHCHGTNLFTNDDFHNNGLDTEPFSDLGLAIVSGNSEDAGKFRTPTLRNIELTAPYMHDGRFSTLEEVIDHYNSGGHYSSTVDPLMKKLGIGLLLTNQEKADLIAFLKTLTDDDYFNE
tara:strand:- start:12142 stop:13230 length:1089 start_codon:yes stop_codon:yes gene_type:complete